MPFGNTNQSAHVHAQLQDLRQYGSVEAYFKRFMQLCAEISDMPLSDGDMIFRFKQGLEDELQMQVAMGPLTNKEYADFTALTIAALAFGAVQERISARRRTAPHVVDAAGHSPHYARATDYCHDRPVEVLGHQAGGTMMMPTHKCANVEATCSYAKRTRSVPDVWLSEQGRALLTVSDYRNGEKPTGECFFNNCNVDHHWQGCTRPCWVVARLMHSSIAMQIIVSLLLILLTSTFG